MTWLTSSGDGALHSPAWSLERRDLRTDICTYVAPFGDFEEEDTCTVLVRVRKHTQALLILL